MSSIKFFTPSQVANEKERRIGYSLSPVATVIIPFPVEEFSFLREAIKPRSVKNLIMETLSTEESQFTETYGLRGLDGYRLTIEPLENGATKFSVFMSTYYARQDQMYAFKATVLLLAFLEQRYIPDAGLKRLPEHRLPYKGAVLYEYDEGDDDTAARICKDIIMESEHNSLYIEDIRGDSSIIDVEYEEGLHSHLHIRFRTKEVVIADLTKQLSEISGSLSRLINKD